MWFSTKSSPLKSTFYHRLSSEGEESRVHREDVGTPSLSSQRSAWRDMTTYSFIIILSISLVILSILHLKLIRESSPPPRLTCGNSVEEAQQAGCSFDRLTKSWLHPGCPRPYDEDFVKYPSRHNMSEWRYWTDLTLSKEITDEDIAAGADRPQEETRWIGTARMHLVHCAFGLMRRSDALHDGKRLDYATRPLSHTKHCIKLLLESAMLAPGIDKPIVSGTAILGAC
ncbi:hypothetical protein NPX13_g7030 [Xylaria arbuscula]|uniref:Uncharacterized protein n=1 Tax=Xylaria arbuscula TaxID=114810 RepID=A0A9W8NBB9_9PEZI|nr:hypothetical protein NPX13_g7030 [Xylaria arbuscula]